MSDKLITLRYDEKTGLWLDDGIEHIRNECKKLMPDFTEEDIQKVIKKIQKDSFTDKRFVRIIQNTNESS